MKSKKVLSLVIVLLIFIVSLNAKALATSKFTRIDKQPEVLKSTTPKYPAELKNKGIEGTVMLDATVDEKGNVSKVKVAKSVNPILDKEAVNAVKQWKFKPALSNGKPVKATLKIPVSFTIKHNNVKPFHYIPEYGEYEDPPIPIKQVAPKYPENIKKLGIEGTVILNTHIDKKGNVDKVEIKKSVLPLLDKEAVKALKQWKFEPAKKDNKPVPIWITIPISFSLH